MKIKPYLSLAAVVSIFCVASISYAGMRGGRQGAGVVNQRIYNPSTVKTVSGTVTAVDQIASGRGRFYGIHIMLKTGNEVLSIHLGPAGYLEQQGMNIQKGDTITVTGSQVTVQGEPAIIAAEVRNGSRTVRLRDNIGKPLWSLGPR